MTEQSNQPISNERKLALVKARSKDFLLDSAWWDNVFHDELDRLSNPKAFARFMENLGRVGDKVIDESEQSEDIRKLIDDITSTPKQILDQFKNRFEKIRYGATIADNLRQQNFGLAPNGERVPLSFGPGLGSELIDEKTDPEIYKKTEWQKAHIDDFSILERIGMAETISVQDRADILLGSFAYCMSKGWLGWAVHRVLPEIAWTLDQPTEVIIEKYIDFINEAREIVASRFENASEYPDWFPVNKLSDLDEPMEEHGFLWDPEAKTYINLDLSH